MLREEAELQLRETHHAVSASETPEGNTLQEELRGRADTSRLRSAFVVWSLKSNMCHTGS